MSVVSAVTKQIVALSVPSKVAIVVSLVLGGLQAVNTAVLASSPVVYGGVTALLVVGAALGISPLVGPQFRAALHLSVRVGYLLTGLVTVLTVALTAIPLPEEAHDVILGILTVAAGLGFAPATTWSTTKLAAVAGVLAPVGSAQVR